MKDRPTHLLVTARFCTLGAILVLALTASAHAVEPSRYAGQDPTEYLKTLEANLAVSSRETDPFGLLQDPDARPVELKPQESQTPKIPAIPLADIIGRIQINTIMPSERKFLIGSRVVSQGDVLPVNFNGSVIRIQIVEVSSRRILFRNPENNDTYAREMDLLPPGMTRGTDEMTPPGMVPDSSGTPLQLDPSPSNPQNRR